MRSLLAPLLLYFTICAFCVALFAVPACGVNCKDPNNAGKAECVAEKIAIDCTTSSAKQFVSDNVGKLDQFYTSAGVNWAAIGDAILGFGRNEGACVLDAFVQKVIAGAPTSGPASAGSGAVAKAEPPRPPVPAAEAEAKQAEIMAKVYPGAKVVK